MRIAPFEIERYYERWEFTAELMLSSSDCESMALHELIAFEPGAERRMLDLRLGYTEVAGSAELRDAVAGLYRGVGVEDVLSVAAAEEALFLAFHALLEPGDEAIVEMPCYGSPPALARSAGAAVIPWLRRSEDGWAHRRGELSELIGANTRLIYLNSPHNPTGHSLGEEEFAGVLELAAEREIPVLCDEVYRGLEHGARQLPAGVERYERAISLGAVSKAQGLPGLRIAWVACRDSELLRRMRELKLYTTICSSAPSELLVALALRHNDALTGRSLATVQRNLPLIDGLLERRSDLLTWTRPVAGATGFARVHGIDDVRGWCEGLARDAGVLLLPGSVYGVDDHVRLGFGRADLPQAIERLEAALG